MVEVQTKPQKLASLSREFKMAKTEANVKSSTIIMDLPECPVCMETLSPPIFQCQSGHSLCNTCTKSLVPPNCPICRQGMTQIRNLQLEAVVNKAKVHCPNKESGCEYMVPYAVLENHIKECIYRVMECPLGVVFGKCFWSGKVTEIMPHFKERHADYCKFSLDKDIVVTNVDSTVDTRYFFLVAQGKMLFIITMKLDTQQKKAFWTVQHIGSKVAAKQYLYEIVITSNRDPRRKASFSEHCFNDAIKADEVIRLGICAVLPQDYLSHFIKDKKLTFRISIKWTATPKKQGKGVEANNENKPPNDVVASKDHPSCEKDASKDPAKN